MLGSLTHNRAQSRRVSSNLLIQCALRIERASRAMAMGPKQLARGGVIPRARNLSKYQVIPAKAGIYMNSSGSQIKSGMHEARSGGSSRSASWRTRTISNGSRIRPGMMIASGIFSAFLVHLIWPVAFLAGRRRWCKIHRLWQKPAFARPLFWLLRSSSGLTSRHLLPCRPKF